MVPTPGEAVEMPAGEDASAETVVLEQVAPAVVSTEDATSQVAALQKLLAAHDLDACVSARTFRFFFAVSFSADQLHCGDLYCSGI